MMVARYNNGNISQVDRIMLKFRPIAPKPANAAVSGGGSGSSGSVSNGPHVKTGRGKRKGCNKYSGMTHDVMTKKPCKCRKKRSNSSPENDNSGGSVSGGDVVKTLPLLPEVPDIKESSKPRRFPMWLSFENGGKMVDPNVEVAAKKVVVGSWVKVERVTDTWREGGENACYVYGGGCTDEERVMSLGVDTCPGFVTDGMNRVRWMNGAYRRMVTGDAFGEVAATVVVEEGVELPVGGKGFTCRVRVVTCGKERVCKTVPCDVWRMDGGGFAWRLDTTAALSLSLGW